MHCPRTADELTTKWMAQVLDLPLVDVELEATGQQAFSSSLTRVHLRHGPGAAADAPASVIVKLASPVDAVRTTFAEPVERELRFYEELGADPGIAVPRCHHVGRADGGFFCLVLEDLGESQIGKSRAEHADALLQALAPFHARWWNGAGLEAMGWLETDPRETRRYAQLLGVALRNLEPLGERFPGTTREVAEFLAAQPDGGSAAAAPGPHTLVHGDLHLQQVFFPGPKGGRFAVFDWQTVASDGNPLRDVSRPLSTSLAPELRRQHEAGWLQRYHARLLEHGVVGFTYDDCLDLYRRSLLTTVFQHVLGAGVADVSHFEKRSRETGVDWTTRFFGWVDATLQDHDVLGRYCKP